ncbi:MAG: DNA repair protein RadC [Acidobacteria bacterium]|nr:DNA repair protein RadC [Acidobacteriota bacterium]
MGARNQEGVMPPPLDANGHRNRLRQRFLCAGAAAFSDHELIELLLTYAIPRRDVKPLAKQLLAKCGSIAGVLGAPSEVLLGVPGVGPSAVALIRLVATFQTEASRMERRGPRVAISSANDAVRYLQGDFLGRREEEIHLLLVDSKNGILGHEILAQGTTDEASLYPRKVLERALFARSSGVLLAHNHPSGDPSPSEADRSLTANIARVLTVAGLRFLDHVIIGRTGHYSFRTECPELFLVTE